MRLLAAVCICILAFVNCYEVKWATRVQDVFTVAKLLALFIIIGTGIIQLGRGEENYRSISTFKCWESYVVSGNVTNFTWDETETDLTKIALSFYSGLFAYNGWNYLNFVIEELQDPVRNLPRAIGISIILVTVVYTLTNIAFYTTLSVPEVLGSEAVAVVFTMINQIIRIIFDVQTFAERLYGPFAFLIPVFVAMSTFGGWCLKSTVL